MSAITRLRKESAALYIEEAHTVWLPINTLIIDPTIQRPLDEKRAQRIADGFDADAFGIIHVSQREDGSRIIVDGQHRVAGVRLLGWIDQRVECKVYSGISRAEEARLFVKLNESVKVQPIPKFNARVVANERVAVAIQRILADNHWRVAIGQSPGCFMAVTAAETVYNGDRGRLGSDGPKALALTLRTITEAWGHDPAGANAYIVRGLGLLYTRHPELDRAALTRKLSAYPGGPSALIGAAKGLHSFRGGTLPQAVAEVIVELYNKKRTAGRLPDWRS